MVKAFVFLEVDVKTKLNDRISMKIFLSLICFTYIHTLQLALFYILCIKFTMYG